MFKKAIIILIVAMLAVPALAKSALKTGSPPPKFSLPNLAGKKVGLEKYLGKKVIILSFFASWSKSCQKELLFLNKLAKKYQKSDLKIIGISFDKKLPELKSFLANNELTFDILRDKKLKTLRDYRILIIPTMFVIDKSGNLNNIYVDFDQNIEQALAKTIPKLLSR